MKSRIIWLFFALTACRLFSAESRQMVDVGGYKLDVARSGEGGPAMIFLHGGGPTSSWLSWLDRFPTTTITYSRAGYGQSEKSGEALRTPQYVVTELHSLLAKLELSPPYILVGSSLGGLYARAFAMKYPREVAGLVFVDSSHEGQGNISKRIPPAATPAATAAKKKSSESDSQEKELPAWVREIRALKEMMEVEKLDVDGPLPDVPMALLTSTRTGPGDATAAYKKEWRALHAQVFSATSYGMHIVTNRSGHTIARDQPEQVELAIKWVLDAVRTKPKADGDK